MKRRFLLGLAMTMSLSAFHAKAEDLTMGKIDAAQLDMMEMSMQDDITAGKLSAAELDMDRSAIIVMIKELNKMQMELSDSSDSRGLMSALGQTISMAESIVEESGNDLQRMGQLKVELREQLRKFKQLQSQL